MKSYIDVRLAAIIVLLCVFSFDVLGNTPQQKHNVVIIGRFLNFDNSIVFEDISDIGELSVVSPSMLIVPDTNGVFNFRYLIDKPRYFRIGRNILYIQPNDSIVSTIDCISPEKSTFSGKNSLIQNYLKITPYPKAGSYLESGKNIKNSIEATLDTLQSIKKFRKSRLINSIGLPQSFRTLEDVRIESDFLNSIYYLHIYFPFKNKLSGDSLNQFMARYRDLIKLYSLKMPYLKYKAEYMLISVYRSVLPQLVKLVPIDKQRNAYWEDWFHAKSLMQNIENANNKDSLQNIALKVSTLKSDSYKFALNNSLKKFLLVNNGDKALNFVFKTFDDIEVSLEQYKGKIIYIDFWATWCGPCLAQFKYLDQLKAKFASSDIVFLSISIDTDIQKWKTFLQKGFEVKYHGIVSQDNIRDYNIASIPRVIIIDKDFKLAEINGILPSSPEAIVQLEKLINKL